MDRANKLLEWPTRLQDVGCLAPIHLTMDHSRGYSGNATDLNVLLPLSTLGDLPKVTDPDHGGYSED